MKKIEYFVKELNKKKYKNIIEKIEHRQGIQQISLSLKENELYGLFTNSDLKEIIKELLDNQIILVTHGKFPEKKSYFYREYDHHYFEYRFTKEFIRGQKNEINPIPKQEIYFGLKN
jgi:hypothetical protein